VKERTSMKRSLTLIALVFFFGITGPAQSKQYQVTPHTEIVKISWGSKWDIDNTQKVPFSIDVKNIGTNKITSVKWQYEILDKYREHTVIDRLTFESEKDIKPGETKHLSKRIDYSHSMGNYTAKAKVIRLRFADGSEWKLAP
jgi:acyl-ACP thioesterase